MDATVKLDQGMRFLGASDSGHVVVMDSDGTVGGNDSGARPMELILMGLCGCTAMDTISILRKKRQNVIGLEVKASADRAEEHPKVFTKIALHYIVTGEDVDPAAVERAIELSAERYCPAQAMLGQVAEFELTYEIVEANAEA
jgi:putative redox protein